MDESGQTTGFGKPGSSTTFNIALLVCKDTTSVNRVLKRFEKNLTRAGWPAGYEIKASRLFGAHLDSNIPSSYVFKRRPTEPLIDIYQKLSTCDIEVDYITVYKPHLNESLKSAPFGIIYNYLAGQVLDYRVKNASSILLTVDAQNKEVHSGRHFDGYVETRSFASGANLRRLDILHLDSARTRCLRAVDYFSWGIYRKYEAQDERFFELMKQNLNLENCLAWFYR